MKTILNKIIIEAKPAEEVTASGIIIPTSAQEKPQQGRVIAIGAGTHKEPMEIKIGDQVLYGKYSGTEVNIDGKDYLVMSQADILVIL